MFVFLQIDAPKSTAATFVEYTLQKGMTNTQIASDLEHKGVIKSSFFFKAYVFISGKHAKLQAGNYALSPSMSIVEIVNKFATGDVIRDKVTFIEGWTLKDIAAYLASKNFGTQSSLIALLKGSSVTQDFSFLQEKPKGSTIEGYLFPDTYEIYPNEKADALLQVILANFDKKITPQMRADIQSQHRTLFQIITMASIIEKEVQSTQDRKMVSGILWKRIGAGIPLQADSTVNYATGKSDTSASVKDTQINSPYNTYKFQGLPAGPISNPGLDSIMAAIYPKDSPYWYYLSATATGQTIFSKTLAEHQAAITKYLTR